MSDIFIAHRTVGSELIHSLSALERDPAAVQASEAHDQVAEWITRFDTTDVRTEAIASIVKFLIRVSASYYELTCSH
jgi:hypothetical protein